MGLPPINSGPPITTLPGSVLNPGVRVGTPPGTVAVPSGISFLATLIIVGAGAELIYNVSPMAAYAFVALVIMGYLAAQGRVENVIAFLNTVQGNK